MPHGTAVQLVPILGGHASHLELRQACARQPVAIICYGTREYDFTQWNQEPINPIVAAQNNRFDNANSAAIRQHTGLIFIVCPVPLL